jgi:hypothetical protein
MNWHMPGLLTQEDIMDHFLALVRGHETGDDEISAIMEYRGTFFDFMNVSNVSGKRPW